MQQLSPSQPTMLRVLVVELETSRGFEWWCSAPQARGRACPDSDIDLGLLYSE